ncbi:NAD(P)/FAD-dependent oxidoreductase [Streptomyces sp. 150FB]|uniref:NAD(P)/FAD-dependent oxidoreductase n=1 Tax=Streptomyces sp. 150FB TaxID=1576605 RepID=UPI0006973492|nr:NAD(P)/FAD-dependent oxidoreductase [Streptomyces sp. 150FB]
MAHSTEQRVGETRTEADIVVVGGGVAGLQAALVLGRARRSVTVVDGGEPRNARARAVHNLAGHEGIAPADLLDRARADARRYGVRIVTGTVTEARREGPDLVVAVGGGGTVRAGALVLATGVAEDLPQVEGLAELWGGDVVSCPYCHGWEAQGLPVAVVGSGARAWLQLLLLQRFTDDLVLLSDGPAELDAARLAHLRRTSVTVREDPIARVVADRGRLTGVEFADGELLPRGVLFASATRRPASALPAALGCDVVDAGVTTDADGFTGVPGVWAVGSCAQPALTVAGSVGHATTTAIALNTALITASFTASITGV